MIQGQLTPAKATSFGAVDTHPFTMSGAIVSFFQAFARGITS